MSRKQIETAHGTIEYETVECASCGNEVKKENVKYFVIGDHVARRQRGESQVRHTFYQDRTTEGYACEFCYDQGPAEFPTESDSASQDVDLTEPGYMAAAAILVLGLWKTIEIGLWLFGF